MYQDSLDHCDTALRLVGDVRTALGAAQKSLPVHADNLRAFLSKTTDALEVVETRLHTASNSIRVIGGRKS